jgi:hypothetical protein
MIEPGRYTRKTATGGQADDEYVFVLVNDEIAGCVQVRRMNGTVRWVLPERLAEITDDENLAAAVEWGIATGQLILVTGRRAAADLFGAPTGRHTHPVTHPAWLEFADGKCPVCPKPATSAQNGGSR